MSEEPTLQTDQEQDIGLMTVVPEENISASLHERATQMVDGYKAWAERYPFAATTAETVALFAVRKAVAYAGETVGLNLGNGHGYDTSKHPILDATHKLVVAPVMEEVLWRSSIPTFVKKKLNIEDESRASRLVDQVAALGFAAVHVGNPVTEKGRSSLAIPITPLIGGEYYTYLAKNRGIKHAILAHAINNTLATVAHTDTDTKNRKLFSKHK